MQRSLVALVFTISIATTTHAQDFVFGPWLQNAKTDGIVVMWEADENESTPPSVDYGLTTNYEIGTVQAVHDSVNGFHVYTATITGLTPDTIYHYRVTSGSTNLADATFKTFPPKGTIGFRFYALGDNRSNPGTWGAIADMVLADMIEYPENHQTFVLNAGDVVQDGSEYNDWDQLWPPASNMTAKLPMYVGFGNHEDRNTSSSDGFLYGYFDFPYLESGSTDEKWYSIDYGNLHVNVMAQWDDSGYRSGPQYDWIQSDLAAARADAQTDWSFSLMHFTPWSLGHHASSQASNQRQYLHPIFTDEGVTLGLGGHNHIYCRYAPVDGVTYITTGGAGAGLSSDSYDPWPGATLEAVAQVHHFTIIDVEEDAISLRAIDLDGNRLDYITFGGTTSNRPPFADAGPNLEGIVGSQVTLDGRASEDPEGDPLTYLWTQVYGTPVTLLDDGTLQPSFTPSVGGADLFELRVFDGTTWSAPDFCLVNVVAGSVTFTPEADTYINNNAAGTNYGTDPALLIDTDPNIYKTYLRFVVSGTAGEILSATLRMYCIDQGNPGEIVTSSDITWPETSPTWDNPLPEDGPSVSFIPAGQADAWSQADVTSAVTGDGPITFIILPSGSSGSDFQSRENTNPPQLVVTYAGNPPQEPTCSISADTTQITTGQSIDFEALAEDPDGGNIQLYEWDFNFDGTNFDSDATGQTVSHVFESSGTYTVALRVTDDEGQTCLATIDIQVTEIPKDGAPDAGSDAADPDDGGYDDGGYDAAGPDDSGYGTGDEEIEIPITGSCGCGAYGHPTDTIGVCVLICLALLYRRRRNSSG